jgi:hypothetical protein
MIIQSDERGPFIVYKGIRFEPTKRNTPDIWRFTCLKWRVRVYVSVPRKEVFVHLYRNHREKWFAAIVQ